MKTNKTVVTKITIELDEQEAMILAKIVGNIGGIHEWRSFTGQLYTELLDRLNVDNVFEFAPDAIKQHMTLERIICGILDSIRKRSFKWLLSV